MLWLKLIHFSKGSPYNKQYWETQSMCISFEIYVRSTLQLRQMSGIVSQINGDFI